MFSSRKFNTEVVLEFLSNIVPSMNEMKRHVVMTPHQMRYVIFQNIYRLLRLNYRWWRAKVWYTSSQNMLVREKFSVIFRQFSAKPQLTIFFTSIIRLHCKIRQTEWKSSEAQVLANSISRRVLSQRWNRSSRFEGEEIDTKWIIDSANFLLEINTKIILLRRLQTFFLSFHKFPYTKNKFTNDVMARWKKTQIFSLRCVYRLRIFFWIRI